MVVQRFFSSMRAECAPCENVVTIKPGVTKADRRKFNWFVRSVENNREVVQ